MANIADRATKATHRISRIEITDERITGRAGLALFGRYLDGIDIFGHLDRLFGGVRKHGKGAGVRDLLRQLFCFLLDGLPAIWCGLISSGRTRRTPVVWRWLRRIWHHLIP